MMSPQKLVKCRIYATDFEAQQARSMLEAEGIQAYVEGSNAITTLSYVGSALGGVRLMVEKSEVERAERVLDATIQPAELPAWQCPNCASQVDAGFAVCWKCGEDYAAGDATDEFPDEGEPTGRAERLDSAPETMRSSHPAGVAPEHEFQETIDLVNRAWRASIFGTVILPILAQLYSLFILFQALPNLAYLPAKWQFRFLAALALDVLALVVVYAFLSPRI